MSMYKSKSNVITIFEWEGNQYVVYLQRNWRNGYRKDYGGIFIYQKLQKGGRIVASTRFKLEKKLFECPYKFTCNIYKNKHGWKAMFAHTYGASIRGGSSYHYYGLFVIMNPFRSSCKILESIRPIRYTMQCAIGIVIVNSRKLGSKYRLVIGDLEGFINCASLIYNSSKAFDEIAYVTELNKMETQCQVEYLKSAQFIKCDECN